MNGDCRFETYQRDLRTSFLILKNHTNGSKLNVIGAYGDSHTNLKLMTGSLYGRMTKASGISPKVRTDVIL